MVLGCGPGRADERLEARAVTQHVRADRSEVLTLHSARAEGILAPYTHLQGTPDFEVPTTLRIWRRSLDGASSSCEGRVDELSVEEYVKGVLPHEWMASWEPASLQAGAIAIRSYALWWAAAGGRYACADLDDTTASQVYKEGSHPRTDAAVEATRGQVLTLEGSLVYAEYSAEHGGRTDFGVEDPRCAGRARRGHGRGLCQWGSQRHALSGARPAEILNFYYPGAAIHYGMDALLLDEGFPRELEAGETAEVYLELLNTGTRSWWTDEVRIELLEESELFDEATWPSPRHPAAVAGVAGPGEPGLFAWTLRAPPVKKPVEVMLDMSLIDAQGQPFGETVAWPIRILPSGSETVVDREQRARQLPALVTAGPATPTTGCGCELGSAGSGGMLLVLGSLVFRARRRARRVLG